MARTKKIQRNNRIIKRLYFDNKYLWNTFISIQKLKQILLLLPFIVAASCIDEKNKNNASSNKVLRQKPKSIGNPFNNQLAFEIISVKNSIDSNTTDTDTTKCQSWELSKSNIEQVIRNSERLDGTAWDM